MLRTLRIQHFVIVDELSVEFGPGLNLLTGETGAGKSILVDAVGLVVGERADRSLVRAGEKRAVVEALFEPPATSDALAWAADAGLLEGDEEQLIVRRQVSAEGSNRIFVNGSPCTLGMLRELGPRLLELHGQHEQQRLLAAERQLTLLDRFGGHEDTLERVGESFRTVRETRERLEVMRQSEAERGQREQTLARVVLEIEGVGPKPGELHHLDRERNVLRQASRVVGLLEEVIGHTCAGEAAAAPRAFAAARSAGELAQLDDGLAGLAQRLQGAALELQDIGSSFEAYRDGRDFDPRRLDELESRRLAIEQLCLKYGEDEQAILSAAEAAREELDGLDGIGERIERIQSELSACEAGYVALARDLAASRRRAARRLGAALQAELGELALGQAKIRVGFTPSAGPQLAVGDAAPVVLGRAGGERAEFELAANPGEPFRPLGRAASGGELSRLMLALHTVFENAGEGRVLVFDEVDAGISGAVADAVGMRLARLAETHQVLCVTHLPQVAAHAERHYRVRKHVAGGRTHAEIHGLSEDERVEELARMLAGSEPTAASRSNAADLIAAAARGAAGSRRSA